MSLQFSNTTSKGGIIQVIERNLKLADGAISDNATELAKFTSDVNLALARAWAIIFASNNTWQWDDSNHTADYPIITTDLVSGQRDYAFLTDNSGNLILDIYKVMVKQPGGLYTEIKPVDAQSEREGMPFYDGVDAVGVPTIYDKTANGFFLDPIPNSSVYTVAADLVNGLKVYINREGSFFTTSDTTKKPGFAGHLHEYIALFVSYKRAVAGSKNKRDLQNDMITMEAEIKKHYARRERDVQQVLEAEHINSV